jgi:hypothetical protein
MAGCIVLACLMSPLAVSAPDPVATKVQGADTAGNPLQIQQAGIGATNAAQITQTGSATGAASAITATITSAPSRMAYLTGFQVTGGGATGASVIVVTVTGIQGGTMSYDIAVPAGATAAAPNLVITFPVPVAASALNTNIVVNVPSFGAGNTNSAVAAQGFSQ